MRLTQILSDHQAPKNKPSKPTEGQLQNELHYHLAEKNAHKTK